MNVKTIKEVIIYNIIVLVCFTVLAVVFNKWWVILFAFLFCAFPKYNGRRFRICDCCGRASESGATSEEAIERAEKCGWRHIEGTDKDFCPECLVKIHKEDLC